MIICPNIGVHHTTSQFEKDTEKELNKKLLKQLADIIEQLQKADHLMEIPHLKKMNGYKNAYRIRFGEYRVGFLYDNNTIFRSRVMNRKEIYRYFP
jgi:mRNA interferase RelE/StbE